MKPKTVFLITATIVGILECNSARAVITGEDYCCEYTDSMSPDDPAQCLCMGFVDSFTGMVDCSRCSGSSGCVNTLWEPYGLGYERITHCTIYGDATYEYRCAKNYYGVTSNGTSGCTRCPGSGQTASGGKKDVTSCYLPSGGSFSDDKGSGTYKDNCYYQN